MKTLITSIFILTTLIAQAQEADDLVLTIAQNEKWLRTIEKLELPEQLAFLKARLLADTNVYVKESHPDAILEKGERIYNGKSEGVSRPSLSVNGKLLTITNHTKPAEVVKFCELLTPKYVRKLIVIDAQKVSNLYGKGIHSGMFDLRIRDKRVIAEIEQLDLDH